MPEPTAESLLAATRAFWDRLPPGADPWQVARSAAAAMAGAGAAEAAWLVEADPWLVPGGILAITDLVTGATRTRPAPVPTDPAPVRERLSGAGPVAAWDGDVAAWLGLGTAPMVALPLLDRVIPPGAGGPPPWGWILVRGGLVPVAVVLQPMVQHALDAALHRQTYTTLFQHSPHPINIHFGQERRFSNPAQERFIGFSDAEIARDPAIWQRISHPDDWQRQRDLVDALWRGEGDRFHYDKRYLLPDGRTVWGRNTYLLLRDRLGRVRHQISYLFDLTLIKAAEQTARDALAAAQRASEVRSRFLANASHEMRTPLHGIASALDLLDGCTDEDERRQLLDTVRLSAVLLLRLVNDVLELARVESAAFDVDLRPHDLAESLSALARTLRPLLAGRPVDLVLDVDPGLPSLLVFDRERIQQVVANLVGNAAKFTRQGRIAVAVRAGERRGDGPVGITIAVTDTGIGMDPGRLATLFEPFTETAVPVAGAQPRGSGLGLAIVRGLVERMGGTVTAASRPGAGTTITVAVPMAVATPDR
jgi:PAS domain S-box-containing protein